MNRQPRMLIDIIDRVSGKLAKKKKKEHGNYLWESKRQLVFFEEGEGINDIGQCDHKY